MPALSATLTSTSEVSHFVAADIGDGRRAIRLAGSRHMRRERESHEARKVAMICSGERDEFVLQLRREENGERDHSGRSVCWHVGSNAVQITDASRLVRA